jgi:hypothetical protein
MNNHHYLPGGDICTIYFPFLSQKKRIGVKHQPPHTKGGVDGSIEIFTGIFLHIPQRHLMNMRISTEPKEQLVLRSSGELRVSTKPG